MIAAELMIEQRPERGAVVLAVRGELDLASSPLLERELVALDQAGAERLVVDLSDVRFMDSTGLHALLAARRRALDSGRALTIKPGPDAVQRIFELTRTATLFEFDGERVS